MYFEVSLKVTPFPHCMHKHQSPHSCTRAVTHQCLVQSCTCMCQHQSPCSCTHAVTQQCWVQSCTCMCQHQSPRSCTHAMTQQCWVQSLSMYLHIQMMPTVVSSTSFTVLPLPLDVFLFDRTVYLRDCRKHCGGELSKHC